MSTKPKNRVPCKAAFHFCAGRGQKFTEEDFSSWTPQGASSEGGGNVTGQPVPYTVYTQ